MEFRVVVFGGKFSGKTWLINAVFGEELLWTQKRTAHCKKHQGNVCGRDLTLVDTPGWWKHFPLSDTANFLKKELIQGVSLCHPGPHAVVLVIEIDIPFTEKHRKAAEDHLGLLGSQIWTYALVVFSRSHALKDKTIEEHIEKEGEALQWLIEKCGNRYHVFNNDPSHFEHFLEKIENIVRSNNGGYFQIEANILDEAAEWKSTVMTKAKSRDLKLQEQKRDLDGDEIRITLLGWVIAGKSSAGNTILNQNVFLTGQSTLNCKTVTGEVDGRPVTVVDTPSWFKYFPSQYTPAWIKTEILKSVSPTLASPHCILLVIPGDTSFKEEQKKVIEENMSLLGEQVWRHTIVLFTWGDILGDLTIEEHIESEGEALQWVIEKCENRYHVFNNEEKENRAQVTGLLQKIDKMVARNSVFRLNTEVFRIPAFQEEVELQTSGCEIYLQEIVQFLDEEWRRKDKELLKSISKLKNNIKAKLHESGMNLIFPLNVSETSSDTKPNDHSEKQECHTDDLLESFSQMEIYIKALPKSDSSMKNVQGEEKSPLKKQMKELLDQEWSRREETLMGRVLETLSVVSKTILNTEPEDQSEKSDREDLPVRGLSERFLKVEKDIKTALPKSDCGVEIPPNLRETLSNNEQVDHSANQESPRDDLLERISQLEDYIRVSLSKSDRSMEFPPNVQDEEKSPLKLNEHAKDLVDREWNRREEALMGRVLEMLSELKCEARSEPTKYDTERSRQKVSDWLQRHSLGYSSAVESNQSEN